MNSRFYIAMILLLALGAGCSPKKPEATVKREKWLASLHDSIASYQKQTEEVNIRLGEARDKVGSLVGSFDYVSNPREVEGYYIYSGWKGRYPLKTTGLVARVTEDERFELIATLTGAHFNEIVVAAGSDASQSEVVPHDQALNYRAGSLNTVCFSGEKADSIGALIASRESSEIKVTYLNGKRTGTLILPENEKAMIAATWRLYDSQRTLHSYEKEIPRLAGKIAACRRMLEAADSTAGEK